MYSYLAIRRADIDVTNEAVSAGTIDNTCTAKLMHMALFMLSFGHTYQCMAMAARLTMTLGLSHLCELH